MENFPLKSGPGKSQGRFDEGKGEPKGKRTELKRHSMLCYIVMYNVCYIVMNNVCYIVM